MRNAVIRRMVYADCEAVQQIEQDTFAMPWSLESFRHEITDNACARYLVAELDGQIVGFAGLWMTIDEGQVTNIAVKQEYRGQGIGNQLFTALMQYAANLGAICMTLEVRRSNLAAQHLYISKGFIVLGVRKRYYEDNNEDAFFMACDHMPPQDPDFEEPETVHEN